MKLWLAFRWIDQTNQAGFFHAASAVVGVPVVNQQPQSETANCSFFATMQMMSFVRVPQHAVVGNQDNTAEKTGVDHGKACCSA